MPHRHHHRPEEHPYFAWLDEQRDASATTILQYTIAPNQVFVSLTQSLVLTITNPSMTTPVTLDGNNPDQINVVFPVSPPASEADGLVDAGVTFTVPPVAGYAIGNPAGSTWTIVPNGVQTIAPGGSITVQFQGVAVNATQPGSPVIAITEYIGDNVGHYKLTVTKLPQTLNIIAWPKSYQVGLNEPAVLYWNSIGGTSVTVNNLPGGSGSTTIPVQPPPPYAGTYSVVLPNSVGWTNHTFGLVVNANDGSHAQASIPISQMPPYITAFNASPAPPNPLPANQSVNLVWSMLFAAGAYLTKPFGAARAVQPYQIKPLTVQPAADVLAGVAGNYAALPLNATYMLQATGFQGSPSATVSFPLAPVGLLYFKFANSPAGGGTPQVQFLLDNPAWTATDLSGGGGSFNDVSVLTVYQPGGASNVYYLGLGDTTHPQVQYFAATQNGNQWTLSWVTGNLVSLTLNGVAVAQGSVASGTKVVTPTTSTTYVLVGTAASGATISSTLQVTVT